MLHILERAAAVLFLLGTAGPMAIAGSQSGEAFAAAPSAGLAYDTTSGQLLKAGPQTLHISRDGGGWRSADLPPSVSGDVRITSIAAAEDGAWYVAGEGMGVLRSTDRGKSWSAADEGLPHPNVTALATHATLPDTVYAVLGESGIYRSQEAGDGWEMMDKGLKGAVLSLIHSDMEGAMETGWIFAGTEQGVQRSMDCFCLWRTAGQLEKAVHSIAFDPRDPKRIYAASRGGLHRSEDGGQEWTALAAPEDIAGLAATPSGVLYAISDEGLTFRSKDGGQGWAQVNG